ncbi:hypothetical protein WMF30_11710 [Sorangium sp. So ce134]
MAGLGAGSTQEASQAGSAMKRNGIALTGGAPLWRNVTSRRFASLERMRGRGEKMNRQGAKSAKRDAEIGGLLPPVGAPEALSIFAIGVAVR